MTERELIGYGPWLKFIWNGHITNWLWRDRKYRRYCRDIAFGEYKMDYLKKYIPFVKTLKSSDLTPSQNSSTNERAYSLWFQGEDNAPEIVKKCLSSVRKYFGENFTVISDKDMCHYISLPDFITKKWEDKKIVPANFSDIVRIELLYNYGGYWFDATDLMTGPVTKIIADSPFFMFTASDSFLPYMFVQTCFIRGKQGDSLMGMWRKLIHEYWKNEDMAAEYFLVHLLLRLLVTYNEEARLLFERMPKIKMDSTHVLWHEIGNLPFDEGRYEKMCNDAFFQKCSYKKMRYGLQEIIPGSFADVVINGKSL